MNMNLHSRFKQFFSFLLLVLLCNIQTAQAASPWQWNLSLKQSKAGESMTMPTALFIDQKKGLYTIVDSGSNRFLTFDRKGELLRIFTAGNELDIPFDMARTDDEGIWVVEKGKNSLSYINLKTKKITPNTLHYKGSLIYPDRLEANEDKLYVRDKATGDILQYGSDLKSGIRFSCEDCPLGFVDFKIYGNSLWALDQQRKIIYRFTLDGQQEEKIVLGGTINFAVSFAVDPSGYLYILDRHNRNVSVHDKEGAFKFSFLAKGIARGKLSYPGEIRFDPWGGLCVLDEANARVEVFTR